MIFMKFYNLIENLHSLCFYYDKMSSTVEPYYNEERTALKTTLLCLVSFYIRVKKRKSWDQQNCHVIRGFCYI